MTGEQIAVAPDGTTVYEIEETPELPAVGDPRVDRRHPIEVTADRVRDHVETYGLHLTPAEVDELADAIEVLDLMHRRIARAARRRARGES